MKQKIAFGVLLLSSLCSAALLAAQPTMLRQDNSYDQMLRYEAGTDHIITPAKVIRALFGSPGTSSSPSNMQFQPIVNVDQSKVRVVAAMAYSF